MPLTTSANYDTYNDGNQHSRVIITFDGIAGTKFSSGDFSGDSSTYKRIIKDCQYNFAKIDPFNNTWESGGCTFSMIDKDDVITDFLYNNAIEELKITIKHGFKDIVEGDFCTLPPVWIKDFKLNSDLMTYEFFCYDIFEKINRNIFRRIPIAFLTADETAGSLSWAVNSTTDFVDPTSLPTGVPAAALYCESEACKYTAYAGNTFTVTRGDWGTTAKAHVAGTKITQGWNLDGNFAEVLLRLLTTTDAGTNGDYDLGFTQWGLEIDEDYVNTTQMEREGWRFHGDSRVANGYNIIDWIVGDRAQNGKQFIVENILKPFNAILYLDEDGKINLKCQDYIREIEDFTNNDLTRDDIEKNISIETLNDNLIHRVRIYAYTYPAPRPTQQKDVPVWKMDNSVTNYGEHDPIEIKSLDNLGGLMSNDGYKQHHAYRFFNMFANLSQKVEFKLKPSNWIYLPNDTIRLTHSKIPDCSTGNRGWTNKKGIITSNYTDLIRMENNSEAIFLGTFDKVSSIYAISKITSMDRSTVQYSATNDNTLEAEDGYFDDLDPGGCSEVFFKLTITPPNNTDAEQYIDIGLWTRYAGPTWNNYNYRIRYNSSWSSAFNVWLFGVYWNDPYNPGAIDRYKVDWWAASASAVSGDRPNSISLAEIWKIEFLQDISEE